MSGSYKILTTARFKKNYEKERQHSVQEWGKAHATEYFAKVRKEVKNIAANPKAYIARGIHGDYRISSTVKGVHILFHVDEKKQCVMLMDIGGRNRLHEMKKEAEIRKTRPRVNLAPAEKKT